MNGITYIQRVNTKGGVAPPIFCHRVWSVGTKKMVPYQADYALSSRSSTLQRHVRALHLAAERAAFVASVS